MSGGSRVIIDSLLIKKHGPVNEGYNHRSHVRESYSCRRSSYVCEGKVLREGEIDDYLETAPKGTKVKFTNDLYYADINDWEGFGHDDSEIKKAGLKLKGERVIIPKGTLATFKGSSSRQNFTIYLDVKGVEIAFDSTDDLELEFVNGIVLKGDHEIGKFFRGKSNRKKEGTKVKFLKDFIYMDKENWDDLIYGEEYSDDDLKKAGIAIKGGDVVIPKGTIATFVFDDDRPGGTTDFDIKGIEIGFSHFDDVEIEVL
jgi:hypothetical protein